MRPKYNKAEGEKERNESQRIASHQSSIGSDMFPSEDLSHKEQQDQQPNHGLAKNLFRRHRAPPLRHINEARDLEQIFHLILSLLYRCGHQGQDRKNQRSCQKKASNPLPKHEPGEGVIGSGCLPLLRIFGISLDKGIAIIRGGWKRLQERQ